jgi:transposase
MDRGMVSEDNIAFLKERGARYLVGTPKSQLRRYEREIREKDWREVREGLEVKLCPSPDGDETFVLCRSKEREAKERAMHERFAGRIEKAFAAIEARLVKGRRPASRTVIDRTIGRILGRNTRAAGLFEVTVDDDPGRGSRLRLTWRRRPEWADWAALSEGCYLLRSNVSDWSAEDLWRTYVHLSQAEDAFRIQKSDLRIRPVWHQKADRVKAHILVCFLAYALWKTLEQWQRRASLGASPRTVIEEMRRIQSTDVVVPTQDGRELRLRCVVRPDKAQKVLLDHLGLDLPERLRVPPPIEGA